MCVCTPEESLQMYIGGEMSAQMPVKLNPDRQADKKVVPNG